MWLIALNTGAVIGLSSIRLVARRADQHADPDDRVPGAGESDKRRGLRPRASMTRRRAPDSADPDEHLPDVLAMEHRD